MMVQYRGIWFPDDIAHKLESIYTRTMEKYLPALDWAIAHCAQHRTAIQAGGNVGLWPKRLAQDFARVITFEPDAIAWTCLLRNVPASVEAHPVALGAAPGRCRIVHNSIGSHHVKPGDEVTVTTIDALGLSDVDFIQLDVEGYEWFVLTGASETIRRCRPLLQLEINGLASRYGQSDGTVLALLAGWGYRALSTQLGPDVVFGMAA